MAMNSKYAWLIDFSLYCCSIDWLMSIVCLMKFDRLVHHRRKAQWLSEVQRRLQFAMARRRRNSPQRQAFGFFQKYLREPVQWRNGRLPPWKHGPWRGWKYHHGSKLKSENKKFILYSEFSKSVVPDKTRMIFFSCPEFRTRVLSGLLDTWECSSNAQRSRNKSRHRIEIGRLENHLQQFGTGYERARSECHHTASPDEGCRASVSGVGTDTQLFRGG